jgi:hypothetical protein
VKTVANLEGFDANAVEPNEGFAAIPAGDYEVVIISSEMKSTKKGDGKYLELKLQVLNGPHQNRQLFDRLNLVNKSAQAVQIAKGTLSAICRAIDVMTPKDSAELHNKPLTATVKTKRDQDGNMQNEVSGYKPRHSTAPAATGEKSLVEQAFEPTAPAASASPF